MDHLTFFKVLQILFFSARRLVPDISCTLNQGLDSNVVHIQQQRNATKDVHIEKEGAHISVAPCNALYHKFEDKHQENQGK